MEKVLSFLHTLFLDVILECNKIVFYCRIIFGMEKWEDRNWSYFVLWKYKKNYLSFDVLRSQLRFTYTKAWDYSFDAKIESIDDFFVNREMILHMILVVLPEEVQIETVLWNMEW